jgi:4-hydroxy-tetrahydrodipicolinate reductase
LKEPIANQPNPPNPYIWTNKHFTTMRIGILGYGKMGHEVEALALSRGHQIAWTWDAPQASAAGDTEWRSAQCIVAFTQPDAALHNILHALELALPLVQGTTGWYHNLNEVEQQVAKRGGSLFWASNFSLGANLFFALNRQLAQLMQPLVQTGTYDVALEEIHHTEKKDAPSGTAWSLAQDILEAIPHKNQMEALGVQASSLLIKPWTKDQHLRISSLRLPNVPGTHTVHYRSEVDSISITHEAFGRKGFALGAVLAAEWLLGKKGMFTMKDMLSFS